MKFQMRFKLPEKWFTKKVKLEAESDPPKKGATGNPGAFMLSCMWLKENQGAYPSEWVALRGAELIAHSPDRKVLIDTVFERIGGVKDVLVARQFFEPKSSADAPPEAKSVEELETETTIANLLADEAQVMKSAREQAAKTGELVTGIVLAALSHPGLGKASIVYWGGEFTLDWAGVHVVVYDGTASIAVYGRRVVTVEANQPQAVIDAIWELVSTKSVSK